MKILIIEDDKDLAHQLGKAVTDAGYTIDMAYDGEDGEFLGATEKYDAVILDLGLPKMSGLSVLKLWRRNKLDMPVLILTAQDSWTEKVAGFDAGADDYVAKPFHVEEILARLRALIRRSAGQSSALLQCGPLILDTRSNAVSYMNAEIDLTHYEYQVLSYLLHHQGRVISRTELTEHIYSEGSEKDSNTIEVFIGRLRRKISSDMIKTVKGRGYMIVDKIVEK